MSKTETEWATELKLSLEEFCELWKLFGLEDIGQGGSCIYTAVYKGVKYTLLSWETGNEGYTLYNCDNIIIEGKAVM